MYRTHLTRLTVAQPTAAPRWQVVTAVMDKKTLRNWMNKHGEHSLGVPCLVRYGRTVLIFGLRQGRLERRQGKGGGSGSGNRSRWEQEGGRIAAGRKNLGQCEQESWLALLGEGSLELR